MLDNSKAINELNWHPKWDKEMLIKNTVKWCREFYKNNLITNNQINDFLKKIKNENNKMRSL